MARSAQQARKPKNKNKQKKKEASEAEDNTTQEDVEMKDESKDEIKGEEQSAESGNNVDGEETTEPDQTQKETKQTTEESKENSDKPDFHKARRTLYIHFPPGPIGDSGMELLNKIYENNGKLRLPQQVCFAAFPSEEIVEKIKPKLEEIEINGQPLTVKYMGAKGTDMDDPCINPYRIKVQGLLVHPDEKLVAKKFPKGRVTLTVKKLKSVTVDFNTKDDAAEALKSAKGLKFSEKPVRVSYVREASENWMEEFLKRKAEREASESPSKKQKTDEIKKKEENNTEESSKEAADENEDDDGEDEDEGEGEGEECEEEAMEGEESEGEGGGDEEDDDDDDDDEEEDDE